MVATSEIPNRAVFRAQEVCDIAGLQLYVLKSWEAEFPDLGVSKAGGLRVYRRADLDRVLRLKKLVFEEGLTLAGARKQLGLERAAPPPEAEITDADVAELLDHEMRTSLRDVRRGLQWVLGVLSGDGVTPEDRILAAPRPAERRAASKGKTPAKPARPTKAKVRKR
jgi:DNA-binding transcriptional MerR regulator